MAKLLKAYVVWGFVEGDGNLLYNSASMADPSGEVILTVRKLNLWGNDFLWASPGDELPGVVNTDVGWMSVSICRDIIDKDPVSGRRLFADRKVDLLAAPMNWSSGGFPATDWMNFVKNNSCALVVANRWGTESNRSFKHDFGQGGSVVIGKDSRPHIGGLVFGADSTVTAMIDL
jgi:predicted amidohydrolase